MKGLFLAPLILSANLAFGQITQNIATPGQPLRPYQPNLAELKLALNLTDTQVEQLKQIQTDRQTALRQVFDQISEKQRILNQLLTSSSPEPMAVGTTTIEMQNLRKQIESTSGNTNAAREKALAVLQPEQKAKLLDLENAAKLRTAVDQAYSVLLLTPQTPVGVQPMGGARK